MRGGGLDTSPFVQDLEACLAVNVMGAARVTAAHCSSVRRTGGRIVNVASVLGTFSTSALGACVPAPPLPAWLAANPMHHTGMLPPSSRLSACPTRGGAS